MTKRPGTLTQSTPSDINSLTWTLETCLTGLSGREQSEQEGFRDEVRQQGGVLEAERGPERHLGGGTSPSSRSPVRRQSVVHVPGKASLARGADLKVIDAVS